MLQVYKEWNGITMGLTIGIFTPIIDGSFLDEKPAVSLKRKEFKKTNILMGANKDEGMFFIFYYMAIGTLIPWNFFINVNGYWMYKFRTVSNHTEEENVSMSMTGTEKNALQIEFTSDLAIAAMIPNVTFLVLNGIIGHRFKMAPRY